MSTADRDRYLARLREAHTAGGLDAAQACAGIIKRETEQAAAVAIADWQASAESLGDARRSGASDSAVDQMNRAEQIAWSRVDRLERLAAEVRVMADAYTWGASDGWCHGYRAVRAAGRGEE